MKKEIGISGIAAIVLLISLGTFQHTEAKSNFFGQYTLQHWDTKNGLPSDLVLSAYQSSDGFIWLTGYSGLIRFDGVTFTSFTSRNFPFLKSDNIHAVWESTDSTLWITTLNNGLLNYKRGVFRQTIPDLALRAFAAETKSGKMLITQHSDDTPYLIVDSQSGKFNHVAQSDLDSLLLNETFFIERRTDSKGGIWVFNNRSVMHTIEGKTQYFTVLSKNYENEIILDLFVDSWDRIWLATTDGLYLSEGIQFRKYPMEQPVWFTRHVDKASKLILEDQTGGIWITYANGLACLTPGSEQFQYLPDKHPLRNISVNEIMEDREGNIWLSTLDGLYRLSKGKFTVYSKEEGLGSRTVRGVAALEAGRYIVATDEGLFRITDGEVFPFQMQNTEYQALLRNIYIVFKDSKQNIWICGGWGAIRISNDGEKRFDARIRFIFEDPENRLWFGIPGNGIAFLNDNDELEYVKFSDVNFSNAFISSIRKLTDNTWFVTTFDNGILIIDADGAQVINDATRELKNVSVFSSYEDEDGIVWLTSSSGLYRYKNRVLTQTGYESGMPEISVFNYLPDNFGYVWFPTNKGILRAKKQEINDYLDKKSGQINWQKYDHNDGMRSQVAVGARHSAISPDGKILIPTFDGLLEIDPSQMISNTLPPPVVIHGFNWNSESLNLSDPQTLPAGNHRFVFEYSALSFTAPEKVAFKFRLIGYDNDWITASGDRRAIYTNLPFGKYTFQVIASNNDGVWNEEGALLHFIITPPWWLTWWAFMLYILIFALCLYGVFLYQRRLLIRRERERAKEKELEHAKEIEKAYTELKETQSQLIHSEKLASLGALTAGIAHEIQNPLNFVNNFSEVNKELLEELREELAEGNKYLAAGSWQSVEEKIKTAEEIANDVIGNEQKINHHGKRAESIVKGMLLHSRGSSGHKEPTDINALCDEYLRLSYHGFRAKDKSLSDGQAGFHAEYKTDLDPGLPKINVVPQDIGRVLLNLINNAFYAVNMRRNTIVKTTHALSQTSPPYNPTVTITTKNLGNRVEISVKDNGNGIPEAIKDKIFQPFFTTKPTGQGTGLGLSLAYDIVKAHGGEIKVETIEGDGTEFIIYLPLN